MLTGKEIYESGMIVGALEKNIQQQGIDVRVKKICNVRGTGYIPAEGKTERPSSFEIKPDWDGCWTLAPGYYEVEFEEGCNLDEYSGLDFKTRSSLIRCGCEIRSGHFDPGFHTEHMGAYLKCEMNIKIQPGACLAQAMIVKSSKVENTYDGQWQGDNQRNDQKTTKKAAKK